MKGKDLLYGKKVETWDKTFGKISALVQLCRGCNNDYFTIIFTKQNNRAWLSLICPVCDKGHFNVDITESSLIGVVQ